LTKTVLLTFFINYVLPVLGSTILTLGTYGVTLLNKRLKNEQIRQALDVLSKVVTRVVQNLNQTLVPEIRAKSTDGVLSKEDVQAIKGKAMSLIQSQVQTELLSLLEKSGIDVDSLINTEIESSVYIEKVERGLL
jgi:hypothetical protein